MARIHQLQRFVGNEADIDTADAAHRTIFHSLRTVTSQRDVERTQSVNLHLIALGERQTQLFIRMMRNKKIRVLWMKKKRMQEWR